MTAGRTREEGEAQLGPGGPVQAVKNWLDDIIKRRDVRSAWQNTDPDYRLALTQAIIFLNDQHPLLSGYDGEELAVALAEEQPTHELWDSFANLLAEEFLNDLSEIRFDKLTAATARPIAPSYELVMFPREHGEGGEPPEMLAHGILVHLREGRWLVAGLSERRAVPGWPPDLGY
jgi:hypothetical protein